MAKEQTLSQKVGSFWNGQQTSGHNGLVLLDSCIQHTIEHRDSDALARFLARSVASNANDGQAVKRIIRAAFGDNIKYKADKAHPSGGKFTLGWNADAAFALRNSYGAVTKAIADKKSFRATDLQKALREQEGKPDPKAREVEDVAKHLVKYILEQVKRGTGTSGVIMGAVEKALANAAMPVVGEPNH